MDPKSLVSRLMRVAADVDTSERPDRVLVARDLVRVLLATDRTLGVAIRDGLKTEIEKLMPDEFSAGDHYDTNPRGKGFTEGYVSWGMQPRSWSGRVGGILFQGEYSETSEAPDPKENWTGRSSGQGTSIGLRVYGGYYNKLAGGGVGSPSDFGWVDVDVDAAENVVAVTIVDPDDFKTNVMAVVSDPPAESKSAPMRRKEQQLTTAPMDSPKNLLKWVIQTKQAGPDGKPAVLGSQLNLLAKMMDGAFATNLGKVEKFFQDRGIQIDRSK